MLRPRPRRTENQHPTETTRHPDLVRHFPLRFRSSFRSERLTEFLRHTEFPITEVDCVDFEQATCTPVHNASSRPLAGLVYGRPLTDPEIAASLSHRRAWARAYQSQCAWAVFYEDDTRPDGVNLETFLKELSKRPSTAPVMINLAPAQTVATRRRRHVRDPFLSAGVERIHTYSTNAQAYIISSGGLALLMRHIADPIVRPPDYPPSITLLRNYATKRGWLVEEETAGASTVGARGSISLLSRGVRWGSRLTGITYLIASDLYGSPANYWRYEVLQRIEHRIWAARSAQRRNQSPSDN